MVALYNQLIKDGLSRHTAWRAAFATVPVPILLTTALLVMLLGTDHPAGKWADRHTIPASRIAARTQGAENAANLEGDAEKLAHARALDEKKDRAQVGVLAVPADGAPLSTVDTAVNQVLTFRIAGQILGNPLTWLPAAAYLTTFGFELAIDAYLANILYGLYKSPSFGQTKAGYVSHFSRSRCAHGKQLVDTVCTDSSRQSSGCSTS